MTYDPEAAVRELLENSWRVPNVDIGEWLIPWLRAALAEAHRAGKREALEKPKVRRECIRCGMGERSGFGCQVWGKDYRRHLYLPPNAPDGTGLR